MTVQKRINFFQIKVFKPPRKIQESSKNHIRVCSIIKLTILQFFDHKHSIDFIFNVNKKA